MHVYLPSVCLIAYKWKHQADATHCRPASSSRNRSHRTHGTFTATKDSRPFGFQHGALRISLNHHMRACACLQDCPAVSPPPPPALPNGYDLAGDGLDSPGADIGATCNINLKACRVACDSNSVSEECTWPCHGLQLRLDDL